MKLQTVVIFFPIWLFLSVEGQIFNGCEYTVLYRHPANCHQYLQCSNGYEYIMSCNDGLVFNEPMQYCDWDYNVPECYEWPSTTTTLASTTSNNCIEVFLTQSFFNTYFGEGHSHEPHIT